jgi:hypothetical protein
VRLTLEEAQASLEAVADRLSLPRSPWREAEFNMLAISGGAAGGAYGAGATNFLHWLAHHLALARILLR